METIIPAGGQRRNLIEPCWNPKNTAEVARQIRDNYPLEWADAERQIKQQMSRFGVDEVLRQLKPDSPLLAGLEKREGRNLLGSQAEMIQYSVAGTFDFLKTYGTTPVEHRWIDEMGRYWSTQLGEISVDEHSGDTTAARRSAEILEGVWEDITTIHARRIASSQAARLKTTTAGVQKGVGGLANIPTVVRASDIPAPMRAKQVYDRGLTVEIPALTVEPNNFAQVGQFIAQNYPRADADATAYVRRKMEDLGVSYVLSRLSANMARAANLKTVDTPTALEATTHDQIKHAALNTKDFLAKLPKTPAEKALVEAMQTYHGQIMSAGEIADTAGSEIDNEAVYASGIEKMWEDIRVFIAARNARKTRAERLGTPFD